MFNGQFIGMVDKQGNQLHEGDYVTFYHKGEDVVCQIVYVSDLAAFCLKWKDGYINKFFLTPDKYLKIEPVTRF
ncbi:MAG TPA: hypothetical protein VNX01_06550 [Bacteroidia bacterium]|jgi:hypothetical protein|nr:hypothetical protein [Bacteroidia bacterium]